MIPKTDQNKLSELKSRLNNSSKILIATHFNADGDAIGSCLALFLILRKLNKDCMVVTANDYPAFLHWMKGNDEIAVHRSYPEKVKKFASEADLLVFLDFNEPKRLDAAADDILASPGYRILIDHHPYPHSFADLILSETAYGSTAEFLYNLILEMGMEEYIDTAVAECIYCGILTDTGAFSYACSYPEVWNTVALLMKYGINRDRINALVYDNYSEQRMRLMGYCLFEKMKVIPEYHTAYIALTQAELNRFNHQPGDTEGFVNLPFSIKGIRFSVLFLEKRKHIKISFRSRGGFAVNHFAMEHFRGGGHLNASGGEWDKPMEEAVKRFESLLKNYSRDLS